MDGALIPLGFLVFGAIAFVAGARWFVRFRREGYRVRLDEFDDPGSGYAAAIFVLVGGAATLIGLWILVEGLLSRLRWT
jgi:hypothetical protein